MLLDFDSLYQWENVSYIFGNVLISSFTWSALNMSYDKKKKKTICILKRKTDSDSALYSWHLARSYNCLHAMMVDALRLSQLNLLVCMVTSVENP